MNVKDAISAVVTSMKPSFTGCVLLVNPSYGVSVSNVSYADIQLIFVGERIKLNYPGIVKYGTVYSINQTARTFIIQLSLVVTHAPTSISVVLVFDHGHPLDIVDTVKQYTQHDTLKFESFPRICLFHDFEEKLTFQKQVSLNLVIVTDTDPSYSAADRYTNSFDPMLVPLYDLFIRKLADSPNLASTEANHFKHTKIDRLYWGKNGLYKNEGNIFNDFIDAIEISNLELILINC